ncbi:MULTISPECIES: xanthine dehydrogenase family protein subunit M [unclassified Bradyrhizobium]|uniref:FAD binding domain-containing protein n=1 Tax=unclassified Bradyrhizobium TaxID=2631580 RepID=UPI00247A95B3|nr:MULTISPECIES: xanthine dehydrogenase family protein subunit M [unclassified Bradyrhizobium]WGS18670.1 xanthine dehydrogenase family protein subunit M [Bradyrhizobium sp. ISRA463]WGS25493.1 xanthine dehydrogenase family protein subunit M [Bradyrhizobium sp. ISRA464]
MKAAAFAYARATSVANALELLAAHGDRAKVLSGGQSLMPAMNLRLVSPDIVVDIGGLHELGGFTLKKDILVIGALTRHVDLLRSGEVAVHAPLLRDAVAHVAHPAIRNRGTLGGSLAHADPASELPACAVTLDATIVVRSAGGERRIAAGEFFRGIYETALSSEELLVAVELPVAGEGSTFFFQEFARRHGDYAIAGLAARSVVKSGTFADLQLGFFAVGDRPLLAVAARRLINVSITPVTVAEAVAALTDELDPQEDQLASAAMRRHLAGVLLRRCVATLLSRPELDVGVAE